MDALIGQSTSALVGLALDATALRQQAIAHNIANANTPGFRPLGVDFESRMAQVREQVRQGQAPSALALAALRPTLVHLPAADGDPKVALDTEVAKLAEITLHQQMLLKALNHHFSMFNTAINEGKK